MPLDCTVSGNWLEHLSKFVESLLYLQMVFEVPTGCCLFVLDLLSSQTDLFYQRFSLFNDVCRQFACRQFSNIDSRVKDADKDKQDTALDQSDSGVSFQRIFYGTCQT